MDVTRVLVQRQATLAHVFRDGETPVDAGSAVTATIKRLDGTAVASGTAVLTAPGSGRYEFALTGQPRLDALTVDWAGTFTGAARTERDLVEVVGGFLFDLAVLRDRHQLPAEKHLTADLEAARVEAEQECERICGQAFVPRFARAAVPCDSYAELLLPRIRVRALRAVTVDGVAWSAEQVAEVQWTESGVLALPGTTWPTGRHRIVVEFEHGKDMPPEYIRGAVMLRTKTLLGRPTSGVPARAAQFTLGDGGVYRLSLPTRESTGIPEVDGAYLKETVDIEGYW